MLFQATLGGLLTGAFFFASSWNRLKSLFSRKRPSDGKRSEP